MKNADMPAMPCGESYKTQQSYGGDWVECKKGALYNGLTKLEEISARIMAGFAAQPEFSCSEFISVADTAKLAVDWAEALLTELEKRKCAG